MKIVIDFLKQRLGQLKEQRSAFKARGIAYNFHATLVHMNKEIEQYKQAIKQLES